MHISDKRYFREWLKNLKPLHPEKLSSNFLARDDLPPLTFSFEASAVYSSNIEGNSIDLDSFMNSKLNRNARAFKAKERTEIETLIEAYRFAQKLSRDHLCKHLTTIVRKGTQRLRLSDFCPLALLPIAVPSSAALTGC